MSYTLLVGGHNCIIAGDFIKKGGCYCRKRGRLLSHKKKFFGLTMRFFRGQFFYNYYNYYNYYERDVTADT